MTDAPTSFGTGGSEDTTPIVNPTDSPSGTHGRSAMINMLGSELRATQDRLVTLEGLVTALTSQVTTDEGTYATITDGTSTGGEIYNGPLAGIPGSPPPRFVAFPTDYDALAMPAWTASHTYQADAWVTHGGTLYQNQTGSTINQSTFSATPWTVIASNGGATLSTIVPFADDSPGSTGTGSAVSREDHVHPDGGWTASDMGYLTWTYPSVYPVNQTQITAGNLYVVKLHMPVAATVVNIHLGIQTAGGTLTSGQCFAALYSGAGALLAKTATQHTLWATVGEQKMALATSQAVAAGDCYVAFWANGTTMPFFSRMAGLTGMSNGNIATAANSRYATDTSHATTTSTAPSTLGTLAAFDGAFWAALSAI